MPWEEVTVETNKRLFITSYLTHQYTISDLCRQYSISRKTGYRLISRYEEVGELCFKSASKRPLQSPNKTSSELEKLILEAREKHQKWGGVKLRTYLLRTGVMDVPSSTTINTILKRHGRITESESQKHRPMIRFEHERPNDLWQMDFKGHFMLQDRSTCYPLTLLDDHSRYVLLIKSCENQTRETVKHHLIQVFREFGLPRRMTMDNGAPWGYSGQQLHTKLCAWLIRIGVIVSHSRPHHPQTQGKLERFHRTLKEELLSFYTFDDHAHAQQGFDWWLDMYNNERPHAAINLNTPSKRYTSSNRTYPEQLSPIEYPDNMDIRKVQKDGEIHFKGKKYRVGKAFRGDPVGIKLKEENLASIYYCQQKILTLDLGNYL